ncbi:YgaB family protein [Peribacillus sp. NPDC097264]|uniref:YgaB family protein n=1 Tax=Peribacillus sp. NPDC097264 TaxID=3390616 RepID=UPI003D0527D5
MEEFNRLINAQLKTMERLLYVQSEIERYQDIEKQFLTNQEEDKAVAVQEEIQHRKMELKTIHETFERQTEDVIRCYQQEQAAVQ